MKQILKVSNIHCESCIKLITKKVSKVPEVENVVAIDNTGTFELSANTTINQSAIEGALKDTEYSVNSLKKLE